MAAAMTKDKYNVWTLITDKDGLRHTWHTIEGFVNLDPDKAAIIAETGNRRSVQFGLGLEYQSLPVGRRSVE